MLRTPAPLIGALGIMKFKLEDIRHYVFPLFVAEDPGSISPDQPIVVSRDRFLGTAFFIAKNGVALTAAHCVPEPSSIPSGHAFLAIVWGDGRPHAQPVQLATVLEDQDIAVLKIDYSPTKYLPISFDPVYMGEDIVTVGVPLHSVSGDEYEFRCLKGNVTRTAETLELSCPAPRGMSGSPILRNGAVVGVMSWNARSEALEDQSEEVVEIVGTVTRVTKTITMAVINYGQAEPLSVLGAKSLGFTESHSFAEFIDKLNKAP